jgi:hypothetical protein
MGKSTATADLLWRNAKRFDLVICFVGSAHCNPVLEALLERYWDPRFFFSEWDDDLIANLLRQQERLETKRSVLILVDDVVLGSKAQEQLATLAMRGRHFYISLFMCCVSYTTLPKRVRRSLDAVLVFSLPMTGDLKVLTWEYTTNAQIAGFALKRLQDHECLVLETLTKSQTLALWKAKLFSPDQVRTLGSLELVKSGTRPSPGTSLEYRPQTRPEGSFSFPDRTPVEGDCEPGGVETQDGCLP